MTDSEILHDKELLNRVKELLKGLEQEEEG